MPASLNDNFMLVAAEGAVTNMAAPGKAIGASSFSIDDATGWPTTTGFIVAIRQVDNNGNEVANTYTEWVATLSGTTISLGSSPVPVVGSDQDYAAGSNTQVYIPVSSTRDNRLVDALLQEHLQTGAHGDVTALSLAVSGDTSLSGNLSVTGNLTLKNNSVLKAALEKPHYNALCFASDTGTVVGATEVDVPFDASDNVNGYGITADTTAHTLTIARDGLYNIQFRYTCIDVAATDFIVWIFISPDGGANWYAVRKDDQSIGVGKTETYEVNNIFLAAGTLVKAQNYNGTGATRFGGPSTSGSSPLWSRLLNESLSITECR